MTATRPLLAERLQRGPGLLADEASEVRRVREPRIAHIATWGQDQIPSPMDSKWKSILDTRYAGQ
jgi:hypothetical protein